MTEEAYRWMILGFITASAMFEWIVDELNLRKAHTQLPQEFTGYYDQEKYEKSQRYLKENTRFGMIRLLLSTPLTLAVLYFGAFALLDQWARSFEWGVIPTGLLFFGALGVLSRIVSLPFSLYHTFVIEERYGFNKTTLKTFVSDLLKGFLLGGLLGGLILAGILWFFESAGSYAWFYAFVAVTLYQLVLTFIAPVVFLPLFNKFTPLPEGELKTAIEDFAQKEDFQLQGIFTMDGSRRSTKANAYFTGFGKFRRIVLFDTLVEKQTTEELVAVLAHEIGHYKCKHIPRMLLASVLNSAVVFYLISIFISSGELIRAVGFEEVSVYAGLLAFGLLYPPLGQLTGLYSLHQSRKYEFEADHFARTTTGKPEKLISALKKLSVDSLSNLTPHWLKVFLEYSHPPVLERIKALRG